MVIFGAVIDPSMGDEVRVTVIATGFGQRQRRQRRQERQRVAVAESPLPRERNEGFDIPADMLDVPSFLRDG
jgi:cell division protein FtsZ